MKNQKHLKPDSEFSYMMWIPVIGLFDRGFLINSLLSDYVVPGSGVEPLPSGFSDRCCGPQVSYPGIY